MELPRLVGIQLEGKREREKHKKRKIIIKLGRSKNRGGMYVDMEESRMGFKCVCMWGGG